MKSSRSIPGWIFAVAICAPLLGLTSPLLEVDDARYAQIPAEMLASGDWVVPTLNGLPYIEKPPLWYWTAAASCKIFGVSPFSVRLMMLCYAFLGVFGIGWLGSWLFSLPIGRAACIATATSALWIFLSHNMTLDMPLSVLLLWTTAFALRAMSRPKDARWAAPATWFVAALAFLTKGLISVLLPALWVGALVVLFPKLRRGAKSFLSLPGLLIAAAVVLPWFAAVQHRRPDFLHVFFIEQHFQRYLTPKYNRGAPLWFYLVVLPAGLLPWTFAFFDGLVRGVRGAFGHDFRLPALALWVIGVTAFFSTSHSKLATYILPVFPHATLLAVVALENGLSFWTALAQRIVGGLLILASSGLAIAFAAGLLPETLLREMTTHLWSTPLCTLALALPFVLGTALVWASYSRASAAILAGGGMTAAVLLFSALPMAAPLISAKDVGATVNQEIAHPDELWTYDTYLHGLPYYAQHPVDKIVQFTGEFHYAKRDPAYAERFGDDEALKLLPRKGGRTFVVMKTKLKPHFSETIAGGPTAIESWRQYGPWSLAVIGQKYY
jgi:4-amino-4-deoxy-L-arabinose transferase-like glycosyltransferase